MGTFFLPIKRRFLFELSSPGKLCLSVSLQNLIKGKKGKGKGTLFSVGSSLVTRLVSMEADGVPFHPPSSICQCSVLRIFKAMATGIRGNSKQTLKSPSIAPGTSCSKSRYIPIYYILEKLYQVGAMIEV